MIAPALRWAGLALLAMMPLHVALRPEHGWLLLSTCDVAAMVTAVALIARWPCVVGVTFLFEVAVGLPAFAIGLCSTYPLNPTGTIIHVVPPLLGGIVVARHGLPARATLAAWCGYTATFIAGYLVAPAALNINFSRFVWPPLARVFPVVGLFQAALLVVIGLLLLAAERVIRRLLARTRAGAPAAQPAAS
jgi:hypothetical protein